jgi:hypothetical protein
MTTIPSIFNTGTGLSIVSSSNQLPSQVNDLLVLGKLTVNQESNLKGNVLAEQNLIVLQQTSTQSLTVNGNSELNSIGSDGSSQFQLPATNGTINQVLTITTENPTTTEWTDKSTVNDEFVKYDTANEVLINSNVGIESNIDNIILKSIGQTNSPFELPITQPTSNGDVLSILDNSQTPPTTEWKSIAGVADFVSYDIPTLKLQSNESNGTVFDISRLTIGELNNIQQSAIVLFQRTDANAAQNINRTTRFKIDSIINGDGIILQSFPNSGGTSLQANMLMQLDALNQQIFMRNSTFVQQKEVVANIQEAKLESIRDARVNKVATTDDRVILSSESGTLGFNQNGIVFSSGSNGTSYVKMPQNQPQAGNTIRIQTPITGTGTQTDPYLTSWGL